MGSGPAGTALAAVALARHALDVLDGHIEKMCGDGGLASGEHGPGTLDAGLDGVGVPGGVLRLLRGRRPRLGWHR